MKNSTLVFILPVIVFTGLKSIHAQSPSIEIGETIEMEKKSELFFPGYDNQKFYVVKTEKERRDRVGFLYAFSRSGMKQIFSVQIVVPHMDADVFTLEEIGYDDVSLKIYYSYYSKKEDINHLMLTEYSLDGKPVGKETELMSSKGSSEDKSGFFIVHYDKDSKNTILLHAFRKSVSNTINGGISPLVRYKFLDSRLKDVYDKELEISADKALIVRALCTDKKGNVYFVYSAFKTALSGSSKLKANIFNASTLTAKEFDLGKNNIDKKKELRDFGDFYYDKDKAVYFISSYNDGKLLSESNGLFIVKINTENLTVEKEIFSAFPVQSPGEKTGKKVVLTDYHYDYYNIKQGNTGIILGEQRYDIGGGEFINFAMTEIKTGDNLDITSQTYSLKYQDYPPREKDFGGYLGIHVADKSFLFFNSKVSELNKDYKAIDALKNIKQDAVACFAEINKDGSSIQKQFPEATGINKLLFRPGSYSIMDDNELLLTIQSGEEVKFAIIKFK